MAPTTSKFDICSAALLSFGARPISSFDESTAESIAAGRLYDSVVDEAFGEHRWNFARAHFRLNRVAGVDPGYFSYVYQLPVDCILLRSVRGSREEVSPVVRYETIRGRMIATDAEAPIAFYTARIPEVQWPAHFTTLVTKRLEAMFIGGLRKDPALAEQLLGRINSTTPPLGALARAKQLDAQEQSPTTLPTGPISRAWGGHHLADRRRP